jgi:hypothetical protein
MIMSLPAWGKCSSVFVIPSVARDPYPYVNANLNHLVAEDSRGVGIFSLKFVAAIWIPRFARDFRKAICQLLFANCCLAEC